MSDKKSMVHVEKARKKMIKAWSMGGPRNFVNMLDQMMELQKRFADKFIQFDQLDNREREAWTKEHVLYMLDELSELLNNVNFKHWKHQRQDVDEVELKYEIIDLLHFLLNLMLIWKMDAKEVFSMYVAKNRENHARQKGGY